MPAITLNISGAQFSTLLGISPRYALLTREEAAQLARVSNSTVTRWISNGALPLVRIGGRTFIRRHLLEEFLTAAHKPIEPAQPTLGNQLGSKALLTLEEARNCLRISRSSILERISEGSLPITRSGRNINIRVGAITDYIDSVSEPATTGAMAGRWA